MKQVNNFPEWFFNMAKDAKLSAKEVVELFGFSPCTSLTQLIVEGSFPAPDSSTQKTRQGSDVLQCKTNLWSKKVILKEIQRRKEITNAASRD